jgi:hypothetical protein
MNGRPKDQVPLEPFSSGGVSTISLFLALFRTMTTTTSRCKNDVDPPMQKPGLPNQESSSSSSRVAGLRLLLSLTILLAGSILICTGAHVAAAAAATTASSTSTSSSHSNIWSAFSSIVSWHIKPIKPHHHGDVIFLTEKIEGSDNYRYKRLFTVPCGDGILVFNIGPAIENQPYSYDIYQDNYAYSDNSGLCVLYPSYKGEQEADFPLWEPSDPTQLTINLGDTPNKISTRIVAPVKAKSFDASKKGGDFCIMRSGNFYNPDYYKHLKHEINMWPENIDDMTTALAAAVQRVDAQMMLLNNKNGGGNVRGRNPVTSTAAAATTTSVDATTVTGVQGGETNPY